VVEHVYDPYETVQKAVQWLKPGGMIQIEVPTARYLVPRIINFYYRLIGSTYVTNISPMHPPYHLYEFTEKSFRAAIERMNASIAKVEYYTGGAVGIPFADSSLLKYVMKKTRTGVELIVWITK
jgi:hypothetical protein